MKPRDLMAKASRSAESARLLLDNGDVDGACNRGHYAMFDAARAALARSQATVYEDKIRTHGGLISAFSLHLVKPGRVSIELRRSLNQGAGDTSCCRLQRRSVEREQAAWLVEQAEQFLAAIKDEFFGNEVGGEPEEKSP